MSIGFGDLVPYNQLPGAVAGQEAMQIVQQVPAGEQAAANARTAQDTALQSDMNTTLQQQKAPSALILSNLKDAQSINHMPIKASYDDLEAAHQKVMGDSDEKPSMLEQKKIMSLADEMAQSRAPKFDPNNPADWLSKQDPTSNAEMTLVKAQAILDGRQQIAGNNLDLRERKFGWEQDQAPIKEAGKDRRAGMMSGVPGAPPIKVQKASGDAVDKFNKSLVGMSLLSPYGRKQIASNENMKQQVVAEYHRVAQLGDDSATRDLYDHVKEFLPPDTQPPAAPAPKVYKNKPAGSRGPNDDSTMVETPPAQGGLTQKPTITPVQDGQQVPNTVKQVVTVGHKVYGVGDKVSIGGVNYEITYGDGKRGGLKRID